MCRVSIFGGCGCGGYLKSEEDERALCTVSDAEADKQNGLRRGTFDRALWCALIGITIPSLVRLRKMLIKPILGFPRDSWGKGARLDPYVAQ